MNLPKVAEQMLGLFEKNKSASESLLQSKADNEKVEALVAELAQFAERNATALSTLQGDSEAKVSAATESLKAQLMEAIQSSLGDESANTQPNGSKASALLSGFSFSSVCLSCNQQVFTFPRSLPKILFKFV